MAKQHDSRTRRASKVHPVPINKMRIPPALVTQRPFRKAHGDDLAANLDLNKLGFPIMNHRDGIFWVLDGQHRIYALKENGFTTDVLDCEVYEGLSDAEMADIFLGRDDRRAVDPFSRFHIACTAGRKRESDIRRTVETQGLKVSKSHGEDCIGAVGALGRVYDRDGAVVLGQALRTIKNAYAGDPDAFDSTVIDGVALIFNRFNGQTNEKELAARLSAKAHGVRGLLRLAESVRARTGNQKSQCVAAAAVEIYNKGKGGTKLPSWWKTASAQKEA